MLNIDSATRDSLKQKGAITYESDGCEVLTGLNTAESAFYLAFDEHLVELPASAETLLYLQLKRRHFAARRATFEGRTAFVLPVRGSPWAPSFFEP